MILIDGKGGGRRAPSKETHPIMEMEEGRREGAGERGGLWGIGRGEDPLERERMSSLP